MHLLIWLLELARDYPDNPLSSARNWLSFPLSWASGTHRLSVRNLLAGHFVFLAAAGHFSVDDDAVPDQMQFQCLPGDSSCECQPRESAGLASRAAGFPCALAEYDKRDPIAFNLPVG